MTAISVGSLEAEFTLDITELKESLRETKSKLKEFADDVDKQMKKSTRATKKFVRAANRIAPSIARGARALSLMARTVSVLKGALVAAVAGFGALKLAGLAAEVSNAEQSFGTLTRSIGGDATEAMALLRKATKGTVDDLTIMQQTNQAIILGVGKNVQEIAKLAEAARRLGKATGRTAAQGMADLAVGIGRQSRLILDNLGIIVRVEAANKKYADSINKTVTELTAQELQASFNLAVMDAIDVKLNKLGEDTLTFADVFARANASMTNFFTNLARNVTPALTNLGNTLQAIDGSGASSRLGTALSDVFDSMAVFVGANSNRITNFINTLAVGFGVLLKVIKDFSLNTFNDLMLILSGDTTKAGEGLGGVVGRILAIPFKIGVELAHGIFAAFQSPEAAAAIKAFANAMKSEFLGIGPSKGEIGVLQSALDGATNLFVSSFFSGRASFGGGAQRERAAQAAIERSRARKFGAKAVVGKLVAGTTESIDSFIDRVKKAVNLKPTFDKSLVSRSEALKKATEELARLSNETPESLAKSTDKFEDLKNAVNEVSAAIGLSGSRGAKELVNKTQSEIDRLEQAREAAKFIGGSPNAGAAQIFDAISANQDARNRLASIEAAAEAEGKLTAARAIQEKQGLARQARLKEEKIELRNAADFQARAALADNQNKKRLKSLIGDVTEGEFLRQSIAIGNIKLSERENDLVEKSLGFIEARLDKTGIVGDARELELANYKELLELAAKITAEIKRREAATRDGIKTAKELADAEGKILKEQQDALVETSRALAKDVGFGLLDAFREGSSAVTALADAFTNALERQLGQLLDNMAKDLALLLEESISTSMGKAISGTLGVAALIGLAALDRSKNKGSEERELAFDEIATDSATAVRGVVAGPENIAIGQAGNAIREANRGVESLLSDILNQLQAMSGFGLEPGGVGSTGAV